MHEQEMKRLWLQLQDKGEFADALLADGASTWSIGEIILLCTKEKFNEAAHAAHLDGWL